MLALHCRYLLFYVSYMFRYLLLLAFAVGGFSAYAAGYSNESVDSLLIELRAAISHRDLYLRAKEERLASIKQRLDTAKEDAGRFAILGELFDEYHPFDGDSAFVMSLRQEQIARRCGDQAMLGKSLLNRANILSATGMFHEAFCVIDSVTDDRLPADMVSYYYHTMRTLYGRLADYASFARDRIRYEELTDLYRDSLLNVNAEGTLVHELIKADQLSVHGQSHDAVRRLEAYMGTHDLSEHEKAIIAWTLAEAYKALGDSLGQKHYLIVSSIADMKSCVREYASLRQLALLLFEEGNLEDAYDFMTVAIGDASLSGARQRIIELSEAYPMINGIYIDTVHKRKQMLERTVVIIALLSVLLLFLLVHSYKQMRSVASARRQLEISNTRLNTLNAKLQDFNAELQDANADIAENSELKEVYISRYMEQCQIYIEKLDAYRKTVAKLLGSGKFEELRDMVRSDSQINGELKLFYEQFDSTFLQLFPTVVEDLNKLLIPGEELQLKKDGSLSAELRIYALIRLGITDSDNIARFLRYSLTTIYNYRTKVRNKARGDRNHLDATVMKLGRGDNRGISGKTL